ncbi:MAG: phosphate ABC transporter substrate-binding protein [Magnetococcus sp. YQC-5]
MKHSPAFLIVLLGFLLLAPWDRAYGSDQASVVIRVKGSDTLTKALKEFSYAYQKTSPHLRVEVTGGGTGNGIAALINGHVEIASASRPMRSREIQLLTKKHIGKSAIAHVVALDAVSVVVHASNPVNGLSLHQLMQIYGKNDHEARWSDFGVKVPGCPDQKITPLSRKNNSGTYVFFRQAILSKHEHFDSQLVSTDGSDTLIGKVAQTPCAIGYAGMAFITGQVKTLCIAKSPGANAPCVPPTAASTLDKSYPLSRSLYLYTLGEPQGEVKQFLDWVKGPEAREILLHTGYVPLP